MDKGLSTRKSEVLALKQVGYFLGKEIGKGSYAKVYQASYGNAGSTRQALACKIFDKERAPKDFLMKFFPREIEILLKIEHPNIIRIHNILERDERVFIFMTYADKGDLLDYIIKNGALPESQAKIWFQQIIKGLYYLHENNIAHRDLKCENILINKNLHIKLADFGFARYCNDSKNRRVLSHTYCGSAAYAAPEVVSGTPYNPKLADVWSAGVVLFIMLNAKMPFPESNLKKLLKSQLSKCWVFNASINETITSPVKSLLRHMLEPDIMLRYNLNQVLNQEWTKSSNLRNLRVLGNSMPLTRPTSLSRKPGKSQISDYDNQEAGPSGT